MLDRKTRVNLANLVYRHKIKIIDDNFEVIDDLGRRTSEKKELMVLWADVKPTRGKENQFADKTISNQTYKITTHYREGISTGMTIEWQKKQLEIIAVIDVSGREEHLELLCVEKEVPSGRKHKP